MTDLPLAEPPAEHPTTSWLVTPAGLSTTASRGPSAGGGAQSCARRQSGARRRPRGRRRAVGVQDPLDALGGADHVVGAEVEHGVFFARICRLIDFWIRRRCAVERVEIASSASSPASESK